MSEPAPLAELVRTRTTLVCCGSGGVGKTTVAAALGLRGARDARRAVVVTIDPAKRLADALGLESLSNTPSQIDGDWPGELWALMLDTKSTFDALVTRYARTDEQAAAILENRFYRNIAGALSGTQEYMAMEKLYELHEGSRFDLVVVDTPPTRNALDFLDAPRRLTRLLDNRIFRLLMMPTRAYLKAVSVATQAFLRTIARVVGSDVVRDVVAFFQAFEGMEEGFRQRAQRVLQLLSDPGTGFILVASPRPDAVIEATYFADRLAESDVRVEVLVMNRVHPDFGPASGTEPGVAGAAGVTGVAGVAGVGALADGPLAAFARNLAEFQALAECEEDQIRPLAERVAPARVVRVPFLSSDVHDLDGLAAIGHHLFRD